MRERLIIIEMLQQIKQPRHSQENPRVDRRHYFQKIFLILFLSYFYFFSNVLFFIPFPSSFILFYFHGVLFYSIFITFRLFPSCLNSAFKVLYFISFPRRFSILYSISKFFHFISFPRCFILFHFKVHLISFPCCFSSFCC